jgi:dihydrofolate reductase
MRKLAVFNNVSVDGYFKDAQNDMGFAHAGMRDPEWMEFASGNASGNGELVFGRITYEMMASFWVTPQAARDLPAVAKGMNEMPKVVFSRTLDKAPWNNTRLVKSDPAAEIQRMKSEPGPDMVILGSGTTIFEGIRDRLHLRLVKSRAFRNGNVVLYYEPAR